jgi:hypothetical protein
VSRDEQRRGEKSRGEQRRALRLEIPIDSDDDRRVLRGALLAARASELTEIQRRAGRLSYGYGDESARETMHDVVDQAQRRWTMLDRLLAALEDAAATDDRDVPEAS